MPTTIHDVADAAGVSITTVSHVLSGRGRVSQKTRDLVLRKANELGYRANVHAQQLVTRRSRTLAVQIANSVEPTSANALVPNSEYFLEVLNGAMDAAAARSYALILVPPDVAVVNLREFAVDGLILVDPLGNESVFSDAWDSRTPVVTTGRPLDGRCRVDAVVDNDLSGAAMLMLDHLRAQGYRRPALITTEPVRSYTADILAGYRAWAASRGGEAVVVTVDERPSREDAGQALQTLLQRDDPPDVIFTSSEHLAVGVLQAAQRHGLRVPEDLGICSAVDSGLLQLITPQVTGMFVHPRQVGREAAKALVDLIEGSGAAASIEVPVRLNMRTSTNLAAGAAGT
ncbi:LacI family transcriptional regulator [Yinghuangia sp. ASG 101]|uniref:LacI family DNA-binding transcriptional regulator n=1 Tax=Yinghuangia sp. ASG 101 TaxID=2896848 RepID=UPI001E30C8ED|nr:LacI family DNA-binding transcriptional regulator [Yinghuangia sp. ASG 101]UGQ12025.1 LacI family transcriptional regulator [Yinghuangia sp. ASG 101]